MRIKITALATIFLGISLLGGCAGLQHRPAPTIEQVVEMAQSGKSAEDIIAELRLTHAVYALRASQIGISFLNVMPNFSLYENVTNL